MIESSCTIEVRYGETDQMGIVNNANYPSYYEIGRTDWLKKLGMSYKQMEEDGIMMPLVDLYAKYYRPAYYENVLTIKTVVKELPTSRMRFDYFIYNQDGTLINEGYTQLAFMNAETRKVTRAPKELIEIMGKYFQE